MPSSPIHLTLMIGPAVPVPVPADVLDALTSVQVTTTAGEASGFQLQFTINNHSSLQTVFLLSGGSPIPLVRVIIVVTVNGASVVLMDGVMTHHELTPGADPGHSTLTVTGKDLTAVMDYIDFSGIPYPAMPAEARVLLILAKYAVLGILPMVIPSVLIDIPLPTERIPRQQGKDLAYVKSLADEVGYVFYLEPGPQPGLSVAYWGPEIKVGAPQPALNVNMDAYSNVESLSFRFNADSRLLPIVFIQNPQTKVPIPIPIPDITPLNPPLGAIPPIPKGIDPITETAKYSPIRGAMIGLAKAAKSADGVTGTGTLDVLRYGRVLRARQLVGVRGTGPAFDGLYYVKSVTHKIKRGEYKQDFTLGRNGLLSTVPSVPA
ncbi:MAG TPA: hypothetical protein VLW52_00680 [Opitutaceae bacterium]|nr:hypothetical protein [Opitutaceae bacterium]